MNKPFVILALAGAVGATAASAQQTTYISPPTDPYAASLHMKMAPHKQTFGVNTGSAFSRNVGPSSSATGNPDTDRGSAASGLPFDPRAPAAGNVTGR